MTIRTINASFESVSTDAEYASVEDGYAAGMRAGLEIAAQEVAQGALSSIVEVIVDLPDERCAARGAVSVSTARLLSGQPEV